MCYTLLGSKVRISKGERKGFKMAVIQDRLTVTFYGENEVKISNEFRELLKTKQRSVNDTLKDLVWQFIKANIKE